jgi:N-acetylmuramoyl-L-alanine amidase
VVPESASPSLHVTPPAVARRRRRHVQVAVAHASLRRVAGPQVARAGEAAAEASARARVVGVGVLVGAVAASSAAYTVRSGDTLSRIAAQHGTTVSALASANGISNPNVIRIGQRLELPGAASTPAPAPAPAPAAPAAGGSHTVARGETLSGIAKRYGTTTRALQDANRIGNPNLIRVGQRLTVPGAAAPAPAPAPTSAPTSAPGPAAPAAGGTHTVARGETLSGIAKRYGTTTRALQDANGISNPNLIRVGLRLTVPGAAAPAPAPAPPPAPAAPAEDVVAPAPETGGTYTVVAGDSLSRIARRVGSTTATLASLNGISDPNVLRVGQVLTLPAGATAPTASPAPAPAPAPSTSRNPTREEARALIVEVSQQYGWDPSWVLALAWQESGWQMGVTSSVGARGIMQVMPGTGGFVGRALVGRTLDLDDPRDNVVAGVAFLDYLFDLTRGDMDRTLAGYYQGLGSVNRNGMYESTKRYIANVRALKTRFE